MSFLRPIRDRPTMPKMLWKNISTFSNSFFSTTMSLNSVIKGSSNTNLLQKNCSIEKRSILIFASEFWKSKDAKKFSILDMSLYSNSHFFKSIVFNFSVKIWIDSFNSLELSSNWNCLIFAESTDFSWSAENAEKCNCYCYFVEIQCHNFLELACDMTLRAQL